MNQLPDVTRGLIVAMLAEGVGNRQIGRVLDVHHETVIRLGRDVGEGYLHIHNLYFHGLKVARLEMDELWSYVGKKQNHRKADDPPEMGTQFSFLAMDAETKAIVSYLVGKRTQKNTTAFVLDAASRIVTVPQITTDGFDQYPSAIALAFGKDVPYAQQIKEYEAACAIDTEVRYRAARVKGTTTRIITGDPEWDLISTAYVERLNLTLRQLAKRWNRLTLGHSKTLRNHEAAMGLFVGYYNFCWIHSTTGKTPAMAAGVVSEPWTAEKFMWECAGKSKGRNHLPPEPIGEYVHRDTLNRRLIRRSFGRC